MRRSPPTHVLVTSAFGQNHPGHLLGGSGLQKLGGIEKTAAYFQSLGLPHPVFQVYFVSLNEVVWSILLLIGLFTRLATLPLTIIMVVAISTARAEQAHSFYSLTGVYEFIYIQLFLYLLIDGAGKISIDAWLRKSFLKAFHPTSFS